MTIQPGDTVRVRGDSREMEAVAWLDRDLIWVQLSAIDTTLYAFRSEYLEVVSQAAAQARQGAAHASVPQVPRRSDPLAA